MRKVVHFEIPAEDLERRLHLRCPDGSVPRRRRRGDYTLEGKRIADPGHRSETPSIRRADSAAGIPIFE